MDFRKVWGYREDVRRLLTTQGRPAEDLRILARRLGRLLNDRLGSNFHWNPSPVLDRGHLVFSGYYDFEAKTKPMSIWINTHPDSRYYRWGAGTNVTWEKFVWDLSECIMHEKVHYLQHRARKGMDVFLDERYGDPEKDYYADLDEVDAYSWSLASECMDRNGLASLLDPPENRATVWWNYHNFFPVHHPVRQRLLKKTYKRLTQALEYQNR